MDNKLQLAHSEDDLYLSPEVSIFQKQKREYNKISYETKVQIVNLIKNEQLSIREVSQLLKVKPCTCKQIMRQYDREGDMRRKSKRRERLDIDLKLNLKILHPLTLKVDETLSIYKHKMYSENKNLNSQEEDFLINFLQKEIVQHLEMLLKCPKFENNQQYQWESQHSYNSAQIIRGIEFSLLLMHTNTKQKKDFLKFKKQLVKETFEQQGTSTLGFGNQQNQSFVLQQKQKAQQRELSTWQQYIQTKQFLELIENKSKIESQIANNIIHLTNESVKQSRRIQQFKGTLQQVDNLGQFIKVLLLKHFSAFQTQ